MISPTTIPRESILAALKAAVEPLEYTHAMWEGGAAAWNRIDQWSDIDLQVDVDDDRVEDAFGVIEAALEKLSPIDLIYVTPALPWPGIFQKFYRLKAAGPYLLIDTAIIQHSSNEKLLQPEIHGRAIFYFDKSGVSQTPAFDREKWQERLQERAAALRATFDMFQTLTLKELHRGNWLEALTFYQGYTLRPLVEALRIRYQPEQYNFHTRYLYYEFPPEVVRRLEELYFVREGQELWARRAEAETWFYETLEQIQVSLPHKVHLDAEKR
jgi:hypothetical protein